MTGTTLRLVSSCNGECGSILSSPAISHEWFLFSSVGIDTAVGKNRVGVVGTCEYYLNNAQLVLCPSEGRGY